MTNLEWMAIGMFSIALFIGAYVQIKNKNYKGDPRNTAILIFYLMGGAILAFYTIKNLIL